MFVWSYMVNRSYKSLELVLASINLKINLVCSYPSCTRNIFSCEECGYNDSCKIHHDWGLSS